MPDRANKRRNEVKGHQVDIPLNEEVFLQPWFLPKSVYTAIRRLLPGIHLAKMRYYFDDYGCLRCGKKESLYGSNGLCETCNVVIRYRVAKCLQRRLKKAGVTSPQALSYDFADQGQLARRLLRDFTLR
jgi:hypothetical protein